MEFDLHAAFAEFVFACKNYAFVFFFNEFIYNFMQIKQGENTKKFCVNYAISVDLTVDNHSLQYRMQFRMCSEVM